MSKTRLLSLIAIAILATGSMSAFAQRGGGGGGAGGARGDFGGRSDSHISSQGLRNTNGPDAADRDKGRARAGDRAELHTRHGKHHAHSKH